jgi:biphenyl 2,3-dioxygenase alpha subunit/dibenzofuran dioxygenase alpha subunit
MIELGQLIDQTTGQISRRIFSDQDIYRDELQRIFGRCWLFLGHESMIPEVGDYFTSRMGEDTVIVVRDSGGRVRAFLNSCPHRGNKVCLFDRGSTRMFTCSYHGWSFDIAGKLVGIPFFNEAYYGELDRGQLGLAEVPKLASYGGMIFANWDPGACPLDDYLGELRWYLDNLLLAEDWGGLEVLPGCQRYMMAGNWKIDCDNFAGDHYHTFFAHGSAIKLGLIGLNINEGPQGTHGYFEIGLHPGHGLGGIYTDTAQYEADLAAAQNLGPEVVDWLTERFAKSQSKLATTAAKPYGFAHGNCFPNLCFVAASSALTARSLILCHPSGPRESEVWQWGLVEKSAPKVLKQQAATLYARGQAAAGFVGQDDYENFERVTENTVSPLTSGLSFHYGMKLGYDGRWPNQESWHTDGLPGLVGPRFTEMNQRRFYARWLELMDA